MVRRSIRNDLFGSQIADPRWSQLRSLLRCTDKALEIQAPFFERLPFPANTMVIDPRPPDWLPEM